MPRKIKVIPFSAVGTATPLHDGTNTPDYPPTIEGALVQVNGGADVYFGDENVSDDSDGYTMEDGDCATITGFLSRGSFDSYDLTKIYYIGGAFKLIIEVEV